MRLGLMLTGLPPRPVDLTCSLTQFGLTFSRPNHAKCGRASVGPGPPDCAWPVPTNVFSYTECRCTEK